jgi:hypothetical protein
MNNSLKDNIKGSWDGRILPRKRMKVTEINKRIKRIAIFLSLVLSSLTISLILILKVHWICSAPFMGIFFAFLFYLIFEINEIESLHSTKQYRIKAIPNTWLIKKVEHSIERFLKENDIKYTRKREHIMNTFQSKMYHRKYILENGDIIFIPYKREKKGFATEIISINYYYNPNNYKDSLKIFTKLDNELVEKKIII